MSGRWTVQDLADYKSQHPRLRMEIVPSEPRPNKYHAKRTEVDGIVFHSKREATRYQDLKVMEQAGIISGLTLQPKYPLLVNGVSVGNFIADFEYIESGQKIVEDTKAPYLRKNMYYRLKHRLMKAIYGITIRET